MFVLLFHELWLHVRPDGSGVVPTLGINDGLRNVLCRHSFGSGNKVDTRLLTDRACVARVAVVVEGSIDSASKRLCEILAVGHYLELFSAH